MTSTLSKQSQSTWAVIPAGGNGERFSGREDKLLANLNGTPILLQTVQALLQVPLIQGIVIAAHPKRLETYHRLLRTLDNHIPLLFTEGGTSRRESVYNGLKQLPANTTIVAIHDAARPMVNPKHVTLAIHELMKAKSTLAGIALGIPIHDTVKRVADPNTRLIVSTVPRDTLWRIQTPQIFWKDRINLAHHTVPLEIPVTDDAQLIELAQLGSVEIFPSDELNVKVTEPADLTLLETL